MPTWPLVDTDGTKHSGGKTVGDYLAGGAAPQVVPSQDGKALLVNASVDADSISKALPDSTSPIVAIVETLRYHAKDAPDGLTPYVTGIGGIFADEFKVFGSLDTTLLGITGLVVGIILILVYRSPVLWFVPLLSALLALSLASGVVYALAKNDVLTLNGQSQGILTVLVFGAATDYALLLVSRYREELHRHDEPLRRDEARVAGRARAAGRVGDHRRHRAAVPAVLRAQLEQVDRSGRRDRHRVRTRSRRSRCCPRCWWYLPSRSSSRRCSWSRCCPRSCCTRRW